MKRLNIIDENSRKFYMDIEPAGNLYIGFESENFRAYAEMELGEVGEKELTNLLTKLNAVYQGDLTEFEVFGYEGNGFKLVLNQQGHITIEGRICSLTNENFKSVFSTIFDVTYLPDVIKEIKKLLR